MLPSLPSARRHLAPIVVLAVLAGCARAPASLTPDPTGLANAEMVDVLQAYASSDARPVSQLTPAEARLQPSAADAAQQVQRARTGAAVPQRVEIVQSILVSGAAGDLPARLYNPRPGRGPLPVILYFGGGGWVVADLDTYDASARALAAGTGAIVVSVMYRRGPENRFPAAHDDAREAYAWLLREAGSIGGDPERVALAGESAGGNLAISAAIAARDGGLAKPRAQLLVYPVAGTRTDTPSAQAMRAAKPLATAALPWFLGHYTTGNPAELDDPRLNPALLQDLHGLPPTTIVLAEIDPLRSGGEVLADRLRAFGVPVESRLYPGVTHEFFGMGAVLADARDAQAFAAARLRSALMPPPAQPAPRGRPTGRRGA